MTGEVLRIFIIILIGAILIITLKTNRPEMSFLLLIAVSVIVLGMIIKAFASPVSDFVKTYKDTLGNYSTVSVIIKAVIISYLAEFCADTCRDNGFSALALKAELCGKCAIFVLSVPLINSILKTAIELTKL